MYVFVIKECIPEHLSISHTEIQQPQGHAGGAHAFLIQSKVPKAAMPLLWVLCTNLSIEVTGKDQCIPRCYSISCMLELDEECIFLLFWIIIGGCICTDHAEG